MRSLLFTLSLLFILATAQAVVVRLAPDFTFSAIGNKTESLKNLRGVPVVLLIAKSPKTKEMKLQAKNLRGIYEEFASKHVIFVAAFTEESGLVPSDIPFVIANNGPAVATAYGVQNTSDGQSLVSGLLRHVGMGQDAFTIVIIGKDGNIDYQTDQVLRSERVRDVIQNSYGVQSYTGR